MIGWYYLGGVALTLLAGIFVVALNTDEKDDVVDKFFYAFIALMAAGAWPVTWVILLIMGAVYKVREMRAEVEDSEWR